MLYFDVLNAVLLMSLSFCAIATKRIKKPDLEMGVEGILKRERHDHRQGCDCFANIGLTKECLKTKAVITAVQDILSMMITLEFTPTQVPRRNAGSIKGSCYPANASQETAGLQGLHKKNLRLRCQVYSNRLPRQLFCTSLLLPDDWLMLLCPGLQ